MAARGGRARARELLAGRGAESRGRARDAAMGSAWEKDRLWLYLLALGFDPKEYPVAWDLGRNMFDKPNHRAFAVISRFLFSKLDKDRAEKTFETFLYGRGAQRQFAKQCWKWLKEISSKSETVLPNIAPSSLMSPAGAKFVHMVYQFARHVMTEDMKTLSVGTGIPFAEAVRWKPEDMYIAEARRRVGCNKLLQVLQKQDFVFQEYQKKSQVLIKEIKETKSEYALMQKLSLRMKQNDQTRSDYMESILKVRSMWTLIMEIFTSLKQDKEVVDSVLEDCVHQCILDGNNVLLRVPGLLARRIESDKDEVFTANVYEDGKLNFLAVIQLLNEALKMLRDEHCQSELKELRKIENMVTSCNKALQCLKTKRLEREQQHCVSVCESISRKEEDWETKWETFLGQHPLNLILKENLDLWSGKAVVLSPCPPEEGENSDLHQSAASVSDGSDSLHKECYEKDEGAFAPVMSSASPKWVSSVPSDLSEVSENRDLLIENNLHVETCEGNKQTVPPKISKKGKEEFPVSEMRERADDVILTGFPVKEEDLLEKARDELAEEVAKAVVSELPDCGEEKGMTFDDLISSLCFNPFMTRREIPRTPANQLTETRSSRRKAVETEDSSNIELFSTEVAIQEVPMDARPIIHKTINSNFMYSVPASPVSDSDPALSEKNSQLSSVESSPEEQVRKSHVFESSDSKTSEILETERSEAQELDCTALSGSSVEELKQALQNVEKSMNIPDISLEGSSRTNVLSPEHCRHSTMDGMLHLNWSSLLSSFDSESMWIWNETLPEYDSMELSQSGNTESDFSITDSANVTGDSENNSNIEKSDLHRQLSLSNSQKALKKTASESEELHQTHNGGESESCRSDLSPAAEGERNTFCSPVVFTLDEEFTKAPLSEIHERQYSLSSLLIPSEQLQEMASMRRKVE
ncbi:HAUS augmin-like complex subunit 6 [Pithys albifrons albifrons]|uniref:HAUS augmin-like complex subunit 6 n=1 Tax=Pithys albifrons albifrons TaxID=3385563 RepID=UPI003A5CB349